MTEVQKAWDRCSAKYHWRVLKDPKLTATEMSYLGLTDEGNAIFLCRRCEQRIETGAPEERD